MKFLDEQGLQYLWKQISLEDYPNNETLIAVLNAIDETKADKDHNHEIADVIGLQTVLDNKVNIENLAVKTIKLEDTYFRPWEQIEESGLYKIVPNGSPMIRLRKIDGDASQPTESNLVMITSTNGILINVYKVVNNTKTQISFSIFSTTGYNGNMYTYKLEDNVWTTSIGLTSLSTSNNSEYTPRDNYNPATKKYVDDSILNIDLSGLETKGDAQTKFDEAKAYVDTIVAGKAAQADLEALAGRVGTAEGKITTLEGEMDAVQALADAADKAAKANAEAIALKADQTALQAEIDRATAKEAAIEAKVDAFVEVSEEEINALFPTA